MTPTDVLVVEDEPRFQRLIRFVLEAGGYRVRQAASGGECLQAVAQQFPDLLILDLMLPDLDGFEVCRRVREVSAVPIIILTAKGAEEDKVKGLRLGADDYVVKPFSAQELLARVEAVLRRSPPSHAPQGQPSFVWGDLRIDFLSHTVTVRDKQLHLSPTEYRLLHELALHSGRVLTSDELLEKVWGPSYRGEHEVLRVAVWRLRQKLEEDPPNLQFIRTIPGVGYLLGSPS
ncbi:MAG: response regulator transcription factor [Chloroflexi bacterium]|nr:response regulator transcription factor [Chloroflexota bacterium]